MSNIVALLVIALLLFFFEIFLPGGILAVIGAVLVLIAAVLAYSDFGMAVSMLIVCGSAILGIGLFFLEIKLLQSTRFGRQLKLESTIAGTSNQPLADESVVGQKGTALTTMNPSGKVDIGGLTFTASTISGFLEKGTPVEVLRIDQFKLIVKKS